MLKVLLVTLAPAKRCFLLVGDQAVAQDEKKSCHTKLAKTNGGTWSLKGNRTALECGRARTTGFTPGLMVNGLGRGQPPNSHIPMFQVTPDRREERI